MLDLYTNIKLKRLENGWTQSELAKKMGYSDKSMIAKIENGKVDLPQSKIKSFADVLGCSVSDLMGWDNSMIVGAKFDYTRYYGEQKASLVEIIENANEKQLDRIVQMFDLLAPVLIQLEDEEEDE